MEISSEEMGRAHKTVSDLLKPEDGDSLEVSLAKQAANNAVFRFRYELLMIHDAKRQAVEGQ